MLVDAKINYRDRISRETVDLPNQCPHCGQIMTPFVYEGFSNFNQSDTKRSFGILVSCSAENCHNFFSLHYSRGFNGSYETTLIPDSYRPPLKVDLPENVEKVSPNFVEIYSQATVAETEKLDQIAGVGYRKSLEFLVKDYAIRNNPDKEDEIKKKMLGPVINEYLTDFPKLKSLSKAATWIGNDETHYERRHTEKDIRDMKAFIRSASQFIAADYDADVAEEFINQ